MTLSLRLSPLLFLGLMTFGCSTCIHKPRQVVVRRVLIDLAFNARAEQIGMSREQVRQIALEVIQRNPHITLSDKHKNAAVLRIRLDKIPADPLALTPDRLSVAVKLMLGPDGHGEQYEWENTVEFLAAKEPTEILETALEDDIQQIVSAHLTQGESSFNLLAQLKKYSNGQSQDEKKTLFAIQVLGNRKEKKATPYLCTLLLREKPPFDMAALAALTLIADPNAIDAISEYAERKPSPIRKQAILAARQMGGKKAAAWLFALSTGHEDPDVRAAAAEALEHVEAKIKANEK